MLEQGFLAHRAHARDVVEDACGHPLPAKLAVERDCETMRLVSDLLDEVQRGRAGRQYDRAAILPGYEQFLVALREAAERYVGTTHFVEHFKGSAELGFTTVEDDKVRLLAETFVSHALVRVAPAHDLLHAEEIVGLVERRFDLETAVLVLVRPAVGEHDHRGDRIAAVYGRYIEAFDAMRWSRKCERALELQKRIVNALVLVVGPHLVA